MELAITKIMRLCEIISHDSFHLLTIQFKIELTLFYQMLSPFLSPLFFNSLSLYILSEAI